MGISNIERAGAETAERRLRVLVCLYVVFVAGFALWVIHQSVEERFTNIFFDDWINLFHRSQHPLLRWLFLHHNGHLIPASKLLIHWDYEHLSGRGDLPIVFAFLCTGITIALLYIFLRRWLGGDALLRSMLAAFFSFCLLWGGLHYGFLWGFSVHAPITTLCAFVSIMGIVAFAGRESTGRNADAWWLVTLSAAGAFSASLGSAAGVGAWAALLVVAVVARLSWRVIIGVVAGGCVSGMMLAIAPSHWGTSATILGLTLQAPATLVAPLLSFVGGPVAWTLQGFLEFSEGLRFQISVGAGGIGVLGLLAYCIQALRRPRAPGILSLLGIGLMVYSVAAGTLVALGRPYLGVDAVQLRYTPFALPFWMGVGAAVASAVHVAGTSKARISFFSILFVVSLSMLPALGTSLQQHQRHRDTSTIALLQILVGIRNDELLSRVTRNADNAKVLLPSLERDRRGPFADPRYPLLGRPIADVYGDVGAVRCSGEIASWRRVDTGSSPGSKIKGNVEWDAETPAIDFILVVDGEGTIRGLGNLRPGAGPPKHSWLAYLGPHRPGRAMAVYAQREDGSVCRFERRSRRVRGGGNP
jgi:hypothetical protein